MEIIQYFFNGHAFYPESETFSPTQPIDTFTSGVWVDAKTYQEFTSVEKAHFYVGANQDGYPCWIEIPQEIIKQEAIAQAQKNKESLFESSTNKVAPLQDAVDLGIATDEEQEQLKAWKEYRVLLNRVDTSTVPDIKWPEKLE